MIKDNQKLLNRFHILIDALLVILAFRTTFYLRFESFLIYRYAWLYPRNNYNSNSYYPPFNIFSQMLLYLVPIYLLAYYFCHLYGPKRSRSKRIELGNLVKANTIVILLTTAFIIFFKKDPEYMRAFLVIFYICNLTFSFLFRLFLRFFLEVFRKKGLNLKHVIIIGYSRAAERYINRVLLNPEWGYYIHGILDDTASLDTKYKNIDIIGNINDLPNILSKNEIDEIAITLSIAEYGKLEHIVAMCEKSGVHTKFIPDYNNIIPTRPYTEDLNGLPVINIRNVPLSNTFNKTIKRILDILGAICALILFSIPMLITAIIIKATSKGPLIFSQVRIGLHNKEFKMYKFRSMTQQTEEKEKKAWTTAHDPRVTPIGKIIRKTSIDELPQLFNVLKGEMSLVGPRPERPFFVDKFKEEIPRYMIKHQVRPGLTGWAQVCGYRGDTSIEKRIEHDLYYIENWTLSLDIKILFMTIFKGFVNKNAY